MVRQRHQPNGNESEQSLGDSEGLGSLACCSPWSHKESDMTERLNQTEYQWNGGEEKDDGVKND